MVSHTQKKVNNSHSAFFIIRTLDLRKNIFNAHKIHIFMPIIMTNGMLVEYIQDLSHFTMRTS